MSLSPGDQIGRYIVEELIGAGGMATVFRVRHRDLGSSHALKVLHDGSPVIEERLRREGRLQASLRHANVVSVTDILHVDGAPGLVMTYVDGPTLDQFLATRRLTIPQADALARGILAGVAEAHRCGVVHRDLKPANILIAPGPRGPVPMISDFGLAKAVKGASGEDAALTQTGQALGTPYYMAPEQALNARDVDVRADVWALGAIFYEMLTGDRAFDAPNLPEIYRRVMSAAYDAPQDRASDVPERMTRAISEALVVDRDQRLADAAALAEVWCGDGAEASGAWAQEDLAALSDHLVPATAPLSAAAPRGEASFAGTVPDFAGKRATAVWFGDVTASRSRWGWWLVGVGTAVLLVAAAVASLGLV